MSTPEFSIVVPVYNEAENITPLLRGIESAVRGDFEIVVVYDFDKDTTLPAIARLEPPVRQVRLLKNTLGKGVVNALRAGLNGCRGTLGAVVFMGDMSDPPERINDLVDHLRMGEDCVAGSRYMKGGSQTGGPWLKSVLARLAGVLAYYITGVGIHDVTNNFRAYSRRLLAAEPIESTGGFEVGLELTAKCHRRGWRLGETPSQWRDRTAGESRFQLMKWLPSYLRWYSVLLLSDPFGMNRRIRRSRQQLPTACNYQYFGVYDQPGYGWIVRRHLPGIAVAAFTVEKKLILLRNWRPYMPPGQTAWEMPGGAPAPSEPATTAAVRELAEEAHARTACPGRVLHENLQATPGMGHFPHVVVVLTDCTLDHRPADVQHEGIEAVEAFTPHEVRQMVRDGTISAMPTIAALAILDAHQAWPS